MIKLQIIGHIGKDATVNDVNGKKVINFNVAHSEKFKDAQGNEKSKTIWAECAKWGDQVKIADYLKKGTQVFVEGEPEATTYKGADGEVKPSLKVRVIAIQLLGGGQAAPAQTSAPAASNAAPVIADDSPF